ncbi:MAG TPA: hypothetical protein VHJ18_12390 [Streptosporangiaceae bacterium]|nr:hypothetical protein [Streptosporangiaceae bacterium]
MSAPVAPPADNALHDGLVIARSLHDPEQFAIVFRRHAPQIQRYVVRRIGRDAADDVVGETFCRRSGSEPITASICPTRGRGCTGSPRT